MQYLCQSAVLTQLDQPIQLKFSRTEAHASAPSPSDTHVVPLKSCVSRGYIDATRAFFDGSRDERGFCKTQKPINLAHLPERVRLDRKAQLASNLRSSHALRAIAESSFGA